MTRRPVRPSASRDAARSGSAARGPRRSGAPPRPWPRAPGRRAGRAPPRSAPPGWRRHGPAGAGPRRPGRGRRSQRPSRAKTSCMVITTGRRSDCSTTSMRGMPPRRGSQSASFHCRWTTSQSRQPASGPAQLRPRGVTAAGVALDDLDVRPRGGLGGEDARRSDAGRCARDRRAGSPRAGGARRSCSSRCRHRGSRARAAGPRCAGAAACAGTGRASGHRRPRASGRWWPRRRRPRAAGR